MELTTSELAALLGGSVKGDTSLKLTSLSKLEEAEEGCLSFLANAKYEPMFYTSQASAILVNYDFIPRKEDSKTLIQVEDVYASLTKLMNIIEAAKGSKERSVSELAFVATETTLPKDIGIGAFSYIGNVTLGNGVDIASHVFIGDNCQIGDHVKIYPGVKIYHDTIIGDNVIIHANAVIGSDGFGFSKDAQGKYIKINQLGNVRIEDDVEIGANTVIDRASLGSTIIHKGVKLDNLIQVAHNVEIGEHTVIAAQSGIAGSTKLGKNCMVGGQVGFVGHLKIADGAQIQAQSGVAGSVKNENAKLYGYPAIDYNTYLRAFAVMKTLPDMAKKLNALEKEVDRLKKEGND